MVRPYRWRMIIGISLLVFGVLFLLQSLMDEVEYEKDGRRLVMKKRLFTKHL